jgi:hypothetical protein
MIKNINIQSLPNKCEKYIIMLINKKPPACYAFIPDIELHDILKKTQIKFNGYSTCINIELIKSIKASYIRNHIVITNHKNLTQNSQHIINDYNNNINIYNLCMKYDISPLNILRYIFKNKYNKKIKDLTINENILTTRDKNELESAKLLDSYALINQDIILENSQLFEKKIELILQQNKIKYKTQEQLVKEQIKLYNRPINTPDFLILSELFINNIKINWIDAKNFYGANTHYNKYKIKKQTVKYINTYNTGCIVFNLGFSSDLNFKKILLVDYISFTQL